MDDALHVCMVEWTRERERERTVCPREEGKREDKTHLFGVVSIYACSRTSRALLEEAVIGGHNDQSKELCVPHPRLHVEHRVWVSECAYTTTTSRHTQSKWLIRVVFLSQLSPLFIGLDKRLNQYSTLLNSFSLTLHFGQYRDPTHPALAFP